jgi:predicted glycoside hydrolase/deacetylase ChbG (UPF0249 family)
VILNADDFGWSEHTVDVTAHCFREGVLSSATLMVNREGFSRAAAFARAHPQFSYGLHICLVDEYPVSSPDSIPSLVARDGRFYPTAIFIRRAMLGQIRAAEVRREITAQVERLVRSGLTPSHFDSHGHIHKVPVVLRALLALRPVLGVPRVRCMQDLQVCGGGNPARRLFHAFSSRWLRMGYRTPDHFLMVTGQLDACPPDWLEQQLGALPSGVTEIGYHPGMEEEPWRTRETSDVLRAGRRALQRSGADLITYHELL